jgi:hypothetical protein
LNPKILKNNEQSLVLILNVCNRMFVTPHACHTCQIL